MTTGDEIRRGVRPPLSVVAVMVAILVAACTGGASSTPGTSATTAPSSAASAPAGSSEPSSTTITLPPPEKASIKIGATAVAANTFAVQFALDAGFYEKHGLDVEILTFEGTAATNALLAGQIDAIRGGDEAAFFSQKTNTPLIMIASFYSRFLDSIVTSADVKTADDLRGKKIGTSTFGAQSHREVLVALESLGLTPSDVEVVEIGGSGDRVAALQAGSVQAIPVDNAQAASLEAEGFNILVKLGELDVEQNLGPIIVSKQFAEQNPNTVLAIVASMLDATQLQFTDTPQAVEALARWEQITPEEAEAELLEYLTVARRDMTLNPDAMVTLQNFLKLQDPSVADVNPEDTYSLRFIQQLKDMGYYKQAGVPGY